MAHHTTIEIDTGHVHVVSTDRSDGDFAVKVPAPDLGARRSVIMAQPWSWLHQVHSADVLDVSYSGEHSGHQADGLHTTQVCCPLSVTTADCGPIVLVTENAVAVVHAGWRGALAGIISVAAERLLSGGARPVASFAGPMISAPHYEFGRKDLEPITNRFGSEVASTTSEGHTALDMEKVIAAACVEVGFAPPSSLGCTSDLQYFSYRVRSESQRMATVAWIDG